MPANERFHTLAFYDNVDNAALAQLPMIPDPMTNTQNSNLVVPDWNLIGLGYGIGSTLLQVQFNAPSLQALWLPQVYPFDPSTVPTYPALMWDKTQSPMRLAVNEQLQVETKNGAGGAIDQAVFLWLFPRQPMPIQGDVRTILATGTTTLTPFTWTNVPITLQAQLPAGRYALVGLSATSAGIWAARVAFVGGVYRPGVIGTPSLGFDISYLFRNGALGVFGEFDHNLVPSIDVFSSSADTAETFYLDLIKIG